MRVFSTSSPIYELTRKANRWMSRRQANLASAVVCRVLDLSCGDLVSDFFVGINDSENSLNMKVTPAEFRAIFNLSAWYSGEIVSEDSPVEYYFDNSNASRSFVVSNLNTGATATFFSRVIMFKTEAESPFRSSSHDEEEPA